MCRKHFFRIVGVEDHGLIGWVHFKCERCGMHCQMDRFYYYFVLRGKAVREWF